MITRNELKYYSSLLQKKFRSTENKFLVDGKKVVLEGLQSRFECEIIFITPKFSEEEKEYLNRIKSLNARIEILKSIDFKRITDTLSPEGIAAVFINHKKRPEITSIKDALIVYLEDITDPGNLGTIIRNCDWFGIKNIFLSKTSAEVFNPKVIRASMGSVFHINIFEDVSLEEITSLKKSGYQFVCSDLKGENLYEFKRNEKTVLFLANETHGPSNELLSISDKIISIPGKGKAESLNVASACAVILWELTKSNF